MLPQSQARTPQRVTADVEVPPHSYIRVHLHPKRFPAAHAVDWGVSDGTLGARRRRRRRRCWRPGRAQLA